MRLRLVLIALAACVALWAAARQSLKIGPAFDGLGAETTGRFTEGGGWFQGEPLVTQAPVRAWGSWNGSDENTGTLRLGPFPAPARLRLAVGGYPPYPGNSLRLELAGTGETLPLKPPAVGERWRIIDQDIPSAWRGRPVVLVAIDEAKAIGGWIAVTEPLRGGVGDGLAGLWQSLAAWAANGLLLGVAWGAALRFMSRLAWLPAPWLPVAAAAVVAGAGYVTFWAYFVGPRWGLATAIAFLAAGAWLGRRGTGASPAVRSELRTVVLLTLTTGLLHLSLLHLFPSSLDFYQLAGNRFRQELPTDNQLPFEAATRLVAGQPLKQADTDWLSSDRPPLQTGWQLLTWGALEAAGMDPRAASGTASVWLQLTWVAAAYALLRTLGLSTRTAAAWTATLALSGFFLQNTIFTWPKLSAAAFAAGAFALWLPTEHGNDRDLRILLGAFLAGMAWISHGGVAFSYLALAPWIAWRCLRGEWRPWLRAALLFAVIAAPWAAYQRFYDPPGNRLLKWHLGGQAAKDERGVWQTLRENYGRLTWEQVAANKLRNLALQNDGRTAALLEAAPEGALDRRNQEFFIAGRALTWWLFGLLLLPFAWRRLHQAGSGGDTRAHVALFAWTAVTVPVWCLLMFEGNQTVIHQGSYAMMLGAFVLLSAWFHLAGTHWLPAVAAAQAFTLITTWVPASRVVGGEASTVATIFALIAGAALAAFILAGWRESGRGRDTLHATPEPETTTVMSVTWRKALPWLAAGLALLPGILCARPLADLWWFGDDWDLLDQISRLGVGRWILLPFAENFVPLFKALWAGLVFASGGAYGPLIAALWLTHALNAALLARVLLRAGFGILPAAFATALFAVSSANIESLAWSVQWSALLATSFFLAAAGVFTGADDDRAVRRRLLLAVLSAASALAFARGVLTGLSVAAVALVPWLGAVRPWRERGRDALAGALPALAVTASILLLAAGNHRSLGGHLGDAAAFAVCHWSAAPLHRLLGAVTWHWPLILALGAVKVAVVILALRGATAPQRRLLALLLAFDLGNAVLLGIGRHHTGLPAANSERYYYTALLCFLPFAGLVFGRWIAAVPVPRPRVALATALLALAALLAAAGWPAAAEHFADHRGRNTREILLRRADAPAEGAVPGIPFLKTQRARELIEAYGLH
jgi:hypothetical protein